MPTYLYVLTRLLTAQYIVCTSLYIFAPKRPAPKRPCAKMGRRQTGRAKTAAPKRPDPGLKDCLRFQSINQY